MYNYIKTENKLPSEQNKIPRFVKDMIRLRDKVRLTVTRKVCSYPYWKKHLSYFALKK